MRGKGEGGRGRDTHTGYANLGGGSITIVSFVFPTNFVVFPGATIICFRGIPTPKCVPATSRPEPPFPGGARSGTV